MCAYVCACMCVEMLLFPTSSGPPPALTAGVGTMKRKRQVRDILDHLDSGYIDDIFNTTPFKKSKLKDKQVMGIFGLM